MNEDVNPDTAWVVPVILKRAKEQNLALEGPVDTEYGWGWEPTSSFWLGQRRVHFYYGALSFRAADLLYLHPGNIKRGGGHVARYSIGPAKGRICPEAQGGDGLSAD